MHYRLKITKMKYTLTASTKTSSSRVKKNPSLTNVSSEIRRSPRLKQNTPLQKQEKKVSTNLRSSKRKSGLNALVLKNYVFNAGAKEKKSAAATQPVTHESSTKKGSSEKGGQNTGSKKRSSEKPGQNTGSKKISSEKARLKTGSKAFVGKNIRPDVDGKENFKDSSDDESAAAIQPLLRESSMKTRSSKKAKQRTESKTFVGKNITLNADRKENFEESSDDESAVATQPVTNKSSRKLRSSKKAEQKIGKTIGLNGDGKEDFKDSSDDESVAATQPLTRESPTKKRNPNVTYSESLFPRWCQSPSIKDPMKENPSQKIGRRSGAAAFAGKIIRLLPDGTENFADYWTDTESSSTDNSTCGSTANKNNTTYNKSFFIVPENQQSQGTNESFSSVQGSQLSLRMDDSSTSLPESRQSPRKNVSFSSVSESHQSPKKKTTPIKDMGKNSLLRTRSAPPKIGRRTGSAAFIGKTIRLLPDGTENFEDYWTDEASSEASDEPEALNYSKAMLSNTCDVGVDDTSIQNRKGTFVLHEPFSSEHNSSKPPKKINVQAVSEISNVDILKSFEDERVVGDRSENASIQDSPNVTSQSNFKEKYMCVANERSENVLPQDSPSVSSENSEANLLKLSSRNSFNYKIHRISSSSRKGSFEHLDVEGESANKNKISSIRSTKSLHTDSEVSRSSIRNNEYLEDGAEKSGNEFENIAKDSGKEINDIAKDLSKEFEGMARDSGQEFENVAKDLSKEFEDIARDSCKEFDDSASSTEKDFENVAEDVSKEFDNVAKDAGREFVNVVEDSGKEFEDIARDSGNELDDFRVNEISSTKDGCVITAVTEKSNSPNAKRKSQVLENDTENLPQGSAMVPEEKTARGPKSKKRKRNKIPQEPVRRSARESVPPLAFWHGERRKHKIICGEFIYQGIDSGWKKDEGAFSALAKLIQLRKKKIKKPKKTKKQAAQKTRVVNPLTNEFVDVELHKPFGSADWSSIKGDDRPRVPYYLTKTFMSKNLSFGFLDLCPLQVKGSQYSPDDNIHFVVQKGRVKVNIHNTTFEFEKYDSFIVPNMEMYSIENLKNYHSLLSFTTFKVPFFPYQCNE